MTIKAQTDVERDYLDWTVLAAYRWGEIHAGAEPDGTRADAIMMLIGKCLVDRALDGDSMSMSALELLARDLGIEVTIR